MNPDLRPHHAFQRLLLLVLAIWLALGGIAHAACSSYAGKVTINEYNIIGSNTETGVPYVELKFVDPAVLSAVKNGTWSFTGWRLKTYPKAGQSANVDLGPVYTGVPSNPDNNICKSTTNLYFRVPLTNDEAQDEVNVVLLDAGGYLVDELRAAMKKNGTPSNIYPPPTGAYACSLCEKATRTDSCSPNSSPQLLNDTDYPGNNSNQQKNIQRFPDGTGVWKESTGGGGSQSEDSLCTTNDNILLVTKTANTYSVAQGANVVYTITVKNGSATTAMNGVTVTDVIPAGLSFVSRTVSTGSTNTLAVGAVNPSTLTWTVGSLAVNATATMTVTATVTNGSSAITNTAEATATELNGGSTQGSATINALQVIMTANPTSLSVGGNVTYTITIKNTSSSTIYDAVASLPFPTGITYVSNTAPTLGSFSRSSDTNQTWNIGTLSAGGETTMTITAQATQMGSFTATTSASTSTNYPGATFTGSATVTVASAASGFNAIDTTSSDYINGAIQTKIAGSAFSLKIGALSGGALASSYSGNVKVELVASNDPSATIDANGCPSGGSVVATQNPVALASGTATPSFTVAEAWRNVRVRITDLTTGTVACSADNFAIRPNALSAASATDGSISTAGTTRTLNATTATGTPTHQAGAPFTLRATATNSSGTATANYTTSPTATIVSCDIPSGCTAGTLSAGSFSASAGAITSNAATYADVGVITAKLVDIDFATVDSDDTPLAQRTVESASFPIGRFVPAYLRTAVATTCPSSYAFSRQPFTVTITARDASGNLVRNYASAITLSDANGITAGALTNTAVAASATPSGTVSTSTPTFSFSTEPTTPKTIKLRAVDADGVSSAGYTEASPEIRSGRFRAENAFGSEMLPLTVSPATVQYYATTGLWTDDADAKACASLPTPTAANGGLVSGTLTAGTGVAASASGSGATQSFVVHLPGNTAKGPGTAGYVDLKFGAIAGWPAWLPPSNTTTRMSFGLYNQQGNAKKIIYRREVR